MHWVVIYQLSAGGCACLIIPEKILYFTPPIHYYNHSGAQVPVPDSSTALFHSILGPIYNTSFWVMKNTDLATTMQYLRCPS
jgi:hypothetical protein